ncbi:DUF1501 domain-containing protein [Singulisphaera rosea]
MLMTLDPLRILTRREVLSRVGTGTGMLGLIGLLGDVGHMGRASGAENADGARPPIGNPLAPRVSHFPAKAKHIIHIYLNGGPSQVDTFDPKPLLAKYEGKTLPLTNVSTERKTGAALPSPFRFQKYGQSGIEFSEIFARTAQHVDDLCVIRSMRTDAPNHDQSMRMMNCGDGRLSRPSLGAWLTYGLGSENENLPGYIVMCPGLPYADVANWRSAFLPGVYQGTYIDTRRDRVEELIENIHNSTVSRPDQRRQLDLLTDLNRMHQRPRAEDDALEARIANFELAYRMQTVATDAFDVSREPQYVQDAYGPGIQARQLLIARRLIERGVRVVQLFHGDVQPWDAHSDVTDNHRKVAGQCDQPIAALLSDLKQRGLLDETLVICGGEFGRTPVVEFVNGKPGKGRDHNHHGFSLWLAGAGVKKGIVHGATDEFGYQAVEKPVHVHDLHATILHLMGFDHTKLTYRYAGRDFRLTDVHGEVVRDILV